ncbi:hypothetical protein [Nocardia sp. NPDC059239]
MASMVTEIGWCCTSSRIQSGVGLDEAAAEPNSGGEAAHEHPALL